MTQIDIPGQEQGVVRVFAISQPVPQMKQALQSASKAAVASQLLGLEVSESDIEIFALGDLAGMGLASYLKEGYAIPDAQVNADRGKLDKLDGYVLLLHSSVARDGAQTITPTADLTLIGTYAEPARSRAAEPIRSAAAAPYSATADMPARPVKSRLGSVMGVVLVAIVILVLWLVLT